MNIFDYRNVKTKQITALFKLHLLSSNSYTMHLQNLFLNQRKKNTLPAAPYYQKIITILLIMGMKYVSIAKNAKCMVFDKT